MIQEKIIKSKDCMFCAKSFEITDRDLIFYDKVSPKIAGVKYSIPEPKMCPDCREQRRLTYINESNLYPNKCGLCCEKIVSRFNEKSGILVYCTSCWPSDNWDFKDYFVEFDLNKSFFEQISELIRKTPFQNLTGGLSNINNNAVYTNHTADISNSYFVFESDFVSDSYYSRGLRRSNNIMDSTVCNDSEYCYSCIDIDKCFNVFYSKGVNGCKDSYFLENCSGCSNCIGCINLVNKEYYIFNKHVSKKEFQDLKTKLSDYKYLCEFRKKAGKFFLENIYPANKIINSENCSGSVIFNSKNCNSSFDVIGCQDVKYCSDVNYSSDLMDISSYGSKSHLMYEGVSVGRYSSNLLFCSTIGKGDNLIYCIDTKKSKNCFGCVNMKWQEYCILNKQYTKEEYEKLVPMIIEHMKKNGEWGEFFPINISPFCYNETLAQEYFPLTKGEVLKKGYNWSDYEAPFREVEKIIPADKLLDNIKNIPDDILNWAIECEVTKKPFRIVKEELEFYRNHNLPIPRKCSNQRHLDRMKLRNPRKIYDRKCDKCNIDIKTTFSSDREEIVYCTKCYNKEIY